MCRFSAVSVAWHGSGMMANFLFRLARLPRSFSTNLCSSAPPFLSHHCGAILKHQRKSTQDIQASRTRRRSTNAWSGLRLPGREAHIGRSFHFSYLDPSHDLRRYARHSLSVTLFCLCTYIHVLLLSICQFEWFYEVCYRVWRLSSLLQSRSCVGCYINACKCRVCDPRKLPQACMQVRYVGVLT